MLFLGKMGGLGPLCSRSLDSSNLDVRLIGQVRLWQVFDVSVNFVWRASLLLLLQDTVEISLVLPIERAVVLLEDIKLMRQALQSFGILFVQVKHANDSFGSELHTSFGLVFEVVINKRAINTCTSFKR